MDMNFTKAHHFSINGGNFGTVNGGVNNYTLTPNAQSSFAGLGLDSIAAGLLPAPPSQGSGLGAGASIHSVPSTPGATNPANLSPPSPTTNDSPPASSAFTISSGSGGGSPSPRPLATPPTGVGEHRHPGASSYRPPPTQQNLDLLTPLTDTLNLRRFTPYQTPQEEITEFPGSPQSTDPFPTPSLNRRTPPYGQVPASPFTPQLPQNSQYMNQATPSTLPSSPMDVSVYRASSASPTGSDAVSHTARSPPMPPYPRNSPPSFDSSPTSPRAAVMPQGPSDSEDPSVIFRRLRADTKGYANSLPHSNVQEYSPSPSLSARPSLPHQEEVPQVDRVPELAAPRSSQHWTPNVISDWTNDVREGDSDARPVRDYQNQPVPQHRVSRPLPSPPAFQPQVPAHSFSLPRQSQQYSIHADTYHAPPYRQSQYQDNQSWPIFAHTVHPPPPLPHPHYPTYQNRLHYNQQQPAYPSTFNYGNPPNFPMPLMG